MGFGVATEVLEWLPGFWSGFRGFKVASGVLEWLPGFWSGSEVFVFIYFYSLYTSCAPVLLHVRRSTIYSFKIFGFKISFFKDSFFL